MSTAGPKTKLGRNPLDQTKKAAPPKKLGEFQTPPTTFSPGVVDKIKSLQIHVDWNELFKATVEKRIRKVTKIFLGS